MGLTDTVIADARSPRVQPGENAARRKRIRRLKETAVSLGMAGPAVALYSLLMVVPVLVAIYLSLTDWDGFSAADFIGIRNYLHLFTDTNTTHSMWVTLIVVVFGSAFEIGLGLAYALALRQKSRTNSVFRALAYYPHVISALILGFLWNAILGTNGAFNSLLASFGIKPVGFLFEQNLALISLIAVIVWAGFGFNVVLFVAALQTVPLELIEAAEIDGASRWQINRHIVIPMISPVVTVALILNLIGLLRVYDIVVSLTGGGPGGATQTYAFVILMQSFGGTKIGYANAQAVFLMIVSAALALLVTALRNRSDRAAGGEG
ncbi:sugar ABC transporter permease [Gryllotalpicola koreensis]|uniref:carbohydrate ABC transporter permease n=1 Tax=Gryllotalpicola koreensis TaxID=993086 RepID=UPI0031DB99CF